MMAQLVLLVCAVVLAAAYGAPGVVVVLFVWVMFLVAALNCYLAVGEYTEEVFDKGPMFAPSPLWPVALGFGATGLFILAVALTISLF